MGCNACYVGETARHFSGRVREHLSSDKASHIFEHLQNSEHCRILWTTDCFHDLDHASNSFQLKIKEAFSHSNRTTIFESTIIPYKEETILIWQIMWWLSFWAPYETILHKLTLQVLSIEKRTRPVSTLAISMTSISTSQERTVFSIHKVIPAIANERTVTIHLVVCVLQCT